VGQWDTADIAAVTPDYDRAMQIPLRAGRFLGEQDTRETPLVCVINQAMAQRYFPGEDPIGNRLRLKYINDSMVQIVGVAEDVRQRRLDVDVLAPATRALFDAQIYVAYLQLPLWSRMTVVVRSPSNAVTLAGALKVKVRELDKDLPVPRLRTMEAVRRDSIAQARFRTLLIELFGLLALLLATVGVYAVVACSVTQRTQEIGIRMALGATSENVMKSVVGQGFKFALLGTGIGLAGALGLTRLLGSLLYNISPTDPLTFIFVSLVLVGVALLASYLPARRAASIDPMTALRHE
jgi:putative ABC transport system permease protein